MLDFVEVECTGIIMMHEFFFFMLTIVLIKMLLRSSIPEMVTDRKLCLVDASKGAECIIHMIMISMTN